MAGSNSSSKASNTTARIVLFLSGCVIVTLCINVVLYSVIGGHENENENDWQAFFFWQHTKIFRPTTRAEFTLRENDSVPHTLVEETSSSLAGLSCQAWGGPSDELAADMVYWRNIPSDAHYTSPFYNPNTLEKFLFFDADSAGFNNKRISFENFVLLAHSMGRTLVMPPKGFWWGFQQDHGKVKPLMDSPRWSFEDFYDIDKIQQAGLKFITMEDFLIQHGLTGKLTTKDGTVSFPPQNRTNWNTVWLKEMRTWLKTVTVQIKWRPEDCIGGFPTHPHNREALTQAISVLSTRDVPGPAHWIDHPTPVDGSVMARMEEVLTGRKQVCLYDTDLQDETYLYYKIFYDPSNYEAKFVTNIRLLIWFYQFLFFENWKQDLWSKRFVRDHLRYKDELQCAAARIVAAMRDKARKNHNSNGEFHTFHIRRKGEFEDQYGNLTNARDIYNIAVKDVPDGSTVYIATDDMNRTVFQDLMDHYDVSFLGDFQDLLGNINSNYYSIIDQLVASRGRVFFGAWCSTFTGYINRMRGYRSQKDKSEGWDSGVIDSYFYNFQEYDKRNKMRVYHPPVSQWFFREFPIAWRDIDHDVESFEDDWI